MSNFHSYLNNKKIFLPFGVWRTHPCKYRVAPNCRLRVEETPPAISGSSATNRTKTATLSTGLEIQVPEYLKPGDFVRVNTTSGKFMSRV